MQLSQRNCRRSSFLQSVFSTKMQQAREAALLLGHATLRPNATVKSDLISCYNLPNYLLINTIWYTILMKMIISIQIVYLYYDNYYNYRILTLLVFPTKWLPLLVNYVAVFNFVATEALVSVTRAIQCYCLPGPLIRTSHLRILRHAMLLINNDNCIAIMKRSFF